MGGMIDTKSSLLTVLRWSRLLVPVPYSNEVLRQPTMTTTSSPTPLKTILGNRYPYAVAQVRDGRIVATMAYATTLEECYFQTMGWNSSMGGASYIMAEQKDLDNTPNYSYWVAV